MTIFFSDKTKDDAFALWAFGMKNPPEGLDAMRKWNERHGHLLELKPHDEIPDSLIKMVALWGSHGPS